MEVWNKAKDIAICIYQLTLQESWQRDYGLRDQIRRATISISSNIAEGLGRESDIEFIRFLVIARGSLFEVKSQLYIALGLKYIDKETFINLEGNLDEIGRMISGLIKYLKNPTKAND